MAVSKHAVLVGGTSCDMRHASSRSSSPGSKAKPVTFLSRVISMV